MNMQMQGLGMAQIQGPVSGLPNTNAKTGNGNGKRGVFESVLAGLLGSQTPGNSGTTASGKAGEEGQKGTAALNAGKKNQENLVNGLPIPVMQGMEEMLAGIPEELLQLLAGMVSGSQEGSGELISDEAGLAQEGQDFVAILMQSMQEAMGKVTKGGAEGVPTEKESANQFMKEFMMMAKNGLLSEEEMRALRDFIQTEKKDHLGVLGKELIRILMQGTDEQVKDFAAKLQAMKESGGTPGQPAIPIPTVTTAKEGNVNPLQANLIPEEEAMVTEKIMATTENAMKKEGQSDSGQSTKMESENQKAVPQETVKSGEIPPNRPELAFQKNLEENLKLAQEPANPEKVETRNLPKYIENQIKNSFKLGETGTREITVKINPEHLGKMTLQIISKENQEMTVKIIAENRHVKEFLDTNLNTLRQSLENSGIRASAFSVEIDFDKGFNQFKESNQSHQDSQQNRRKVREIREEQFDKKMESIFTPQGGLEVFA